MNTVKAIIAYLKARLFERSTWIAIGVAVAGAAALPMPWGLLFVAVGVIGTLTPEPPK